MFQAIKNFNWCIFVCMGYQDLYEIYVSEAMPMAWLCTTKTFKNIQNIKEPF